MPQTAGFTIQLLLGRNGKHTTHNTHTHVHTLLLAIKHIYIHLKITFIFFHLY